MLLLGAVTASAAAPTGPYDGNWRVEVVADSGTCGSYRLPIAVNGGQVRYNGLFGASVTGSVDGAGNLSVLLAHADKAVRATGALDGESGSGRWSAPALACSGQWVAERV